jgi:hypothetical protein
MAGFFAGGKARFGLWAYLSPARNRLIGRLTHETPPKPRDEKRCLKSALHWQ